MSIIDVYTHIYTTGPALKKSLPQVKPSPSQASEGPHLDPKYLPQRPQPEMSSAPSALTPSVDHLTSVTPGVLRPAVGGRVGGRGGRGRGGRGGRERGGVKGTAEQVPLRSAYFPS